MKNKDKKVKEKKQKEKSQEVLIDEELKKEHKKLIDKLAQLDPKSTDYNYDEEYDKTLKRIKEFEDIQRKKEVNINSDKDSKRKNIGSTLITGGVTLVATQMWHKSEQNFVIGQTGKTIMSSIGNFFKKK